MLFRIRLSLIVAGHSKQPPPSSGALECPKQGDWPKRYSSSGRVRRLTGYARWTRLSAQSWLTSCHCRAQRASCPPSLGSGVHLFLSPRCCRRAARYWRSARTCQGSWATLQLQVGSQEGCLGTFSTSSPKLSALK